jgi:hypothetical protein
MEASGAAQGGRRDVGAAPARLGPHQLPPQTAPLTSEQRHHLLFVLDLVDQLAARHGFDPAELLSTRTGAPLGPTLARMRAALVRENGTQQVNVERSGASDAQ